LIFNQWGELFFESTDQDNGWDGKKNGTEVQNGTYVYVLKVKLDNGEEESLTGHVTVIR